MAINDIYKVALVGVGRQGQELVNTLYYRMLTDTGGLDMPSINSAWQVQCLSLFLATFAGGAAITTVQLRGITDPTAGMDFDVTGHPAGTGGTGDELPSKDTAVISFRTNKIGRSFRGRNFAWPMSESNQKDGNILSAYATALLDYALSLNVLLSGLGGTEIAQHVVWSRELSQSTDVTHYLINSLVGSQARRKPGRGA